MQVHLDQKMRQQSRLQARQALLGLHQNGLS